MSSRENKKERVKGKKTHESATDSTGFEEAESLESDMGKPTYENRNHSSMNHE
jgi:hypothetical protein